MSALLAVQIAGCSVLLYLGIGFLVVFPLLVSNDVKNAIRKEQEEGHILDAQALKAIRHKAEIGDALPVALFWPLTMSILAVMASGWGLWKLGTMLSSRSPLEQKVLKAARLAQEEENLAAATAAMEKAQAPDLPPATGLREKMAVTVRETGEKAERLIRKEPFWPRFSPPSSRTRADWSLPPRRPESKNRISFGSTSWCQRCHEVTETWRSKDGTSRCLICNTLRSKSKKKSSDPLREVGLLWCDTCQLATRTLDGHDVDFCHRCGNRRKERS
jgi:hypothetical protein